ncbi:MBL fold metallo-hydrolase [Nocardioides rotundus]|uniref:MBL fold metallo-hydrolase n=1 Tax=Nocardioides rotundus TaxID=1774216 RepID=UPI001CBF7485|nr:MBL fold metallo-hydrolase [Nocardioides rotundus]UAL29893.1 MBL fold metallo-hydrolase [Nocardioides rotundus]
MRVAVDLGEEGAEGGSHAAGFDPDILVLTHSDSDHVGGFEDFITARRSRLREIWVPYEWGLLVQALAGLVGVLRTGTDAETGPEDLRDLGASVIRERKYPPAVVLDWPWREDVDALAADVEMQMHVLGLGPAFESERPDDDWVQSAIRQAINKERVDNPAWPPLPQPEEVAEVVADLTAKSQQLLSIVESTLKAGIRVRFFSTDAVGTTPPWTSAGRPGMLTLVNAVEVFFVRSKQTDPGANLYLAMRLTAQNRRALAPFLWDAGCVDVLDRILQLDTDYWDERDLRAAIKPWGVLIWSDGAGDSARVTGGAGIHSDFVPWEHVALMTAPHHASATEDHRRIWEAREAFCKLAGRHIPVLSAGGNMPRTAAAFTDAVPSELRACTRCRHLKERPSKTVVAVVDGPGTHLTPTCQA